MKAKGKLDRSVVREIEGFLRERQAQLHEAVRVAVARRRAHEPSRTGDEATVATETLGAEIQLALADRQSRQVAQIDAALERLARDEYGMCHDCGDFIGIPRLRALPFAQRCGPCQSASEGVSRLATARLRRAA
jgi:DnaK suppressor protein